jgi:ATP-dependent DNA helicase DinG
VAGRLVTFATLRDGGEADPEIAWHAAEQRTGAAHMASPAVPVDAVDNATLVDALRAEEESSLPWHRCDARRRRCAPPRATPGGVRARIQDAPRHRAPRAPASISPAATPPASTTASARLIRTATDRGAFVDLRTPSRLPSAFPPGVTVRRAGPAEAAREVRDFLGGA